MAFDVRPYYDTLEKPSFIGMDGTTHEAKKLLSFNTALRYIKEISSLKESDTTVETFYDEMLPDIMKAMDFSDAAIQELSAMPMNIIVQCFNDFFTVSLRAQPRQEADPIPPKVRKQKRSK